jgi:hypothetical protein
VQGYVSNSNRKGDKMNTETGKPKVHFNTPVVTESVPVFAEEFYEERIPHSVIHATLTTTAVPGTHRATIDTNCDTGRTTEHYTHDDCPVCKLAMMKQALFDQGAAKLCKACNGIGYPPPDEYRCKVCDGYGIVSID